MLVPYIILCKIKFSSRYCKLLKATQPGIYLGEPYNLRENNQDKEIVPTTKNHGRLGGIRQQLGTVQKQPCHLPEEVYNSCVLPAMTYGAEAWTQSLTKQAQNKLAVALADQHGKKKAAC